jgi:tellurite resistance-related uncharacterized protein
VKSLPDSVRAYRSTPEFDETSVPASLLGSHDTRPGVWGRIQVIEGELLLRILEPELEEVRLTPQQPGIVEPGVRHQVRPLGRVRFRVEFLR